MILAIDPGESTGLAWQDGGTNYKTTVAPTHEAVYQAIQKLAPDIIIVEWFITGQRLNYYSRRTIELCGACEALAYVTGAKLIKHTPKTRYPGMDEAERILIAQRGPRGTTQKGRGVWTDHEQDALGHLCVYLELAAAKPSPLPKIAPAPRPKTRPRR